MKKSILFILSLTLILFFSCKNSKQKNSKTSSLDSIPTDTLRVVTQYGATSYFLFQDDSMGYDFEMIKGFADYLHLPIKLTIAVNDNEMYNILKSGLVDIAAYNTVETKKLKKEFKFVFPQDESYLVIVQRIGRQTVTDPLQLKGKEVWVKEGSIQLHRLKALNDEIGGGIRIKIASDSLSSDDLMQQVSDKKIDYTIAYRNKALLQKEFDNTLDVRVPIGFNQQNGWLIRKNEKALTDTLNYWLKLSSTTRLINQLYKKYWEKNPFFNHKILRIPRGAISPYDAYFKKYASVIDCDWRLLAAIGYSESGFDNNAVSWAGARGIMQLMPQTARQFGLDENTYLNPEKNIAAGVEYIKSLQMIFRKIDEHDERMKFVLGSYNSGPAHILDAMALARKYGKNSEIWYDNVEYYLSKLNEPEYYNDPVCKYGYFNSTETVRYVPYVMSIYEKYQKKTRK